MTAFTAYTKFKQGQISGSHFVDFDSDTIKIALVNDTYAPDVANHEFFSDAKAAEVVGGNYVANGSALANKTVTVNGAVVKFDADDVLWAVSATGFVDARYAILYKDTGTAGTSALIGVLDLGQDYGNAAGDFSLRFDATNGIFTFA